MYFKKRNPEDLKLIIQLLDEKLSYNVLKYGEYKNKELKSYLNFQNLEL